jgi:cell division protein FtsB
VLVEIKRKARSVVAPVIFTCLFFYFGYHALHGEKGVVRYFKLKKEIEHTRKLAEQKAEYKNQLENRVKRLSPQSLDLDLLEERARLVLNYGENTDLVIIQDVM